MSDSNVLLVTVINTILLASYRKPTPLTLQWLIQEFLRGGGYSPCMEELKLVIIQNTLIFHSHEAKKKPLVVSARFSVFHFYVFTLKLQLAALGKGDD